MIYLALIPIMAVLARMAGGGLGAHWLAGRGFKWLPEALFALPLGYAAMHGAPSLGVIAFLLGSVWAYIWMQTGHGAVLHWGDTPAYSRTRRQFLSPLVDWIAEHLEIEIGSRNYCRLFMAVKGFLIGLPAGGIPLAIMWPASYELGKRTEKSALCEYVSGACAGAAVLLCVLQGS